MAKILLLEDDITSGDILLNS